MSKQLIPAFAKNPNIQDIQHLSPNWTLDVSEFFYDSIQGEGIYTGHPAAFLRLKGCTLQCTWCFHKGTIIQTLNRGQQKISDIKEGEEILTLDTSNNIVVTTVKTVLTHKVDIKKEVLRIIFDNSNKATVVTKSHPFYVKGKGWVKAGELSKKDIIIEVKPKEIISWKMQNNNPMFDSDCVSKMKTTYAKGMQNGSIIPYERTKEHREYQALLKLGDNNPMKNKETVRKNAQSHNYKKSELEKLFEAFFALKKLPIKYIGNSELAIGNSDYGYKFPDFKVIGKRKVIEVYDTTFQYNGVFRNKLTYENERKKHYKQFGYKCLFLTQNDFKDEENLQDKLFEFVFNGAKILEIKKAKEITIKQYVALFRNTKQKKTEVYNLSCSPYNTYLANNNWVHNCDTTEVWRAGDTYSFAQIFDLIDNCSLREKLASKEQHLVITGGSPLKQQYNLINFILAFKEHFGFFPFIEIENEVKLKASPELHDLVDCWNNSPKLTSSGNLNSFNPEAMLQIAELDNSWFKFVIDNIYDDWKEIEWLITENLIRKDQVILMPQGQTREELEINAPKVVELAIEKGVKFCNREHIILWNKKTGV